MESKQRPNTVARFEIFRSTVVVAFSLPLSSFSNVYGDSETMNDTFNNSDLHTCAKVGIFKSASWSLINNSKTTLHMSSFTSNSVD